MDQAPLSTPAARRERDAIVDLCRDEVLSSEAMLEALSHRLRRIIPFDACFWSATDPLTGLATAPARVENIGDEYCSAYWEREFLAEDFLRFTDLARADRPVGTLHEATAGRPRRSGRYLLLNQPAGLDDEMRVAFRSGGAMWGVVDLYREEGRPPFSAAEQKVMADLSQPIADAFRRLALIRTEALLGSPEAPGLLMFGGDGVLESMNDEAEAWLRMLPPDPGYAASGLDVLHVTTEVITVVHQARAVSAGLDGGVARARLRARNGRWLVVHASCLRGADGRVDRVAVVIEAATASEVAPIIVKAYGLTPREREITEAVARGSSTGEIAAALHLSPHTVRDHLKAVFEKTGVSSRGELVAMLFAEHYAPAINDRIVVDLG